MSDNDLTSGDPWGLSSTDTDSAPPPAPVTPQDELPEDLADLSTIADIEPPLADEASPEIDPPALPDMEIEEPELDVPGPSVSEIGTDLDLGDLGNFSDLAEDLDLGPLEESALAEGLEADGEFSAGLVEDALADLSIGDDLSDLGGDGSDSSEEPNPSTDEVAPPSRPMNPLLAASGLFGGSPSLPPLKVNESEITDKTGVDEAVPEETNDIDDPPLEFEQAISAVQFDDSPVDFDSVELADGILPEFDVLAVEVSEPTDIDAELAETLTALGDQPADAITFGSDSVFGADDQHTHAEQSTDDSADFYPEFMSLPDTSDDPRLEDTEGTDTEDTEDAEETDGHDSLATAFGDTDFTAPGPPPAIYQELEHLGDDDQSDDATPDGASETVQKFDVVFGGSNESADDPFGAVFGSGDDAIAAVAAAAASFDTKQPTTLEQVDTPTVDDLPDFMIDDEPGEETAPEVAHPEPGAEGNAESSEASDQDEPMSTLGFVDSDATDDSTGPLSDEPAPEAFAAEEEEEEATTAAADADEAPALDAWDEPVGSPGESDDDAANEAPIQALPPMETLETPTFYSDPFAARTDDQLLKVDAADLEPADAAVHPPILGTIATGVIAKKPIPEDWGTRSDDAYEGWVQDDEGVETWRMIITNLPTVAGYDIDEFLGLAVADSLVGSHDVQAVAGGRRAAIDALTEDGVLRGAHAIVAVMHAVQPVDNQMLVTVSGTAVTLKPTAIPHID